MNILFLHGVSAFGGSAKSLLELFKQLKLLGVNGDVLCPRGASEELLASAGMRTHKILGLFQFDNTLFGHYRKLRWLILIREFCFLFPTLLGLAKLKFKLNKVDVIHANEINYLLMAIFAKKLFKCPLVVHVRSVQRGSSRDVRTRVLFYMLNKHADKVIAIDETVKASMPADIDASVIHNGINLPEHLALVGQKSLPAVPRVGMVGSLIRAKGIYEFLESARILVNERGQQLKFVIVGENARESKGIKAWLYKQLGFSDDVMADLLQFIKEHSLESAFEIKGFVKDVQAIYPNLDILCFPSLLNAAGRPVFEAAFFGIPSVVAVCDPKPDTIVDKVTGLCVPKPEPEIIADALEYLVKNPHERVQLGKNAQQLAVHYFDITKNAQLVHQIYQELNAPRGC